MHAYNLDPSRTDGVNVLCYHPTNDLHKDFVRKFTTFYRSDLFELNIQENLFVKLVTDDFSLQSN